MALTHDQIEDLENSMVAAQQVNLGQIINFLSGSVSASSAFVPTAAVSSIATGLNVVGFATVELSGSVAPTHTYVTVTGSSAGVINIYAWTVSGSLLVAATSPFTMVTWRAYGT
jgi:hypothetical protein